MHNLEFSCVRVRREEKQKQSKMIKQKGYTFESAAEGVEGQQDGRGTAHNHHAHLYFS